MSNPLAGAAERAIWAVRQAQTTAARAVRGLQKRNLHKWVPGWTRHALANRAEPLHRGHKHLLFAICDHYEPLWGRATDQVGERRVEAWRRGYPVLARQFRDADGRHPRHSFFFPGEEYRPAFLDGLAELGRAGFGEVELHLHHDGDTAEHMRSDVQAHLAAFAGHGHLSRKDGRIRYAFIHGNWCLANARADGRWCGVDEELPLLYDTGCYADFTFPAAPDESQPSMVNQIYWPQGDLARRRAYEGGTRARVGERKDDRLLMIQGPLALAWRGGRVPVRIENGALAGHDPGTPERIRTWVSQNIHVQGRPEWIFVKVHAHGAPEAAGDMLLGAGAARMHQELTTRYNDGRDWSLHYVTAREMYNVAVAAMDGKSGDPRAWFDYDVAPPPVAAP